MARQPNFLFLLSDEHAFRYMGHRPRERGGEPVVTPAFDRLAGQATVFDAAYCQMPLCTPSRLCLLTGREAHAAGAWSNESVLPPGRPTVAETLGNAGYRTALIGKMHLGGSRQFAGFHDRPYGDLAGKTGHQWEPLDDDGRERMRTRTAKAGVTGIPESLLQEVVVAEETVAYLREQQARNPDQPWFLCASFSRPHFPLTAPQRWLDRYWPEGVTEPAAAAAGDAYEHPMSRGMRAGFEADAVDHDEMLHARAAYFACVSYLDEIIGDLLLRLEASGLLDDTVVIYTSDHGEMAGEHGVWWKNGWYEACTRVPLIVSLPQQRAGMQAAAVIDQPVALTDLYPTMCALAAAQPPAELDGADLAETLHSGVPPRERPIYCDELAARWGAGNEFRMVRWQQFKYVHFRDAEPLFFDLEADPAEQHNLLQRGVPEDAREAQQQMAAWAAESIDFAAVERDRAAAAQLADQFPLPLDERPGNLYLMPSGQLVSADETLYRPRVLADDVRAVFSDLPE